MQCKTLHFWQFVLQPDLSVHVGTVLQRPFIIAPEGGRGGVAVGVTSKGMGRGLPTHEAGEWVW